MANDNRKKKSNPSAKDIAESMAANITANMADPDWANEKDRIEDEVRSKIIAQRKEREARGERNGQANVHAQDVAKVMAVNMAANMADPNFEIERERRMQAAADKALAIIDKNADLEDED